MVQVTDWSLLFITVVGQCKPLANQRSWFFPSADPRASSFWRFWVEGLARAEKVIRQLAFASTGQRLSRTGARASSRLSASSMAQNAS